MGKYASSALRAKRQTVDIAVSMPQEASYIMLHANRRGLGDYDDLKLPSRFDAYGKYMNDCLHYLELRMVTRLASTKSRDS
jgi:hypothetical protein